MEGTDEYDFALTKREVEGTFLEPKARRRSGRRALRQIDPKTRVAHARTIVQPVKHAPLRIVVSGSDLPSDDAFRWETEAKGAPVLVINEPFPAHDVQRSARPRYNAYIGLLIALAFAEKRWNVVHRQGLVDYVLDLAAEAAQPQD